MMLQVRHLLQGLTPASKWDQAHPCVSLFFYFILYFYLLTEDAVEYVLMTSNEEQRLRLDEHGSSPPELG